ncbi:MAG: GNAT family N-acetyltransferase [Mucilaginibacter sp.]
MAATLKANKITDPGDLRKAFAIRYEVFVDEQNCPPELETEGNDISTHFLATVNDDPAGAARWRKTDKGIKLERFAVLKKYRGLGVGQALVKAVLEDLPQENTYIYLHSQSHATGLYDKLGFEKVGDEFEEAGMKHFKMVYKVQ